MSSAEIAVSIKAARSQKTETQYLVLDTESVPDGRLISQTRYRGENLDPEEAIRRAQAEARERSGNGSDFLPVSYQYPVAVCVLRLDASYEILAITCLDAPRFRPPEVARKFWEGVAKYPNAKLVTFNGRGFDLPLLELAAFRYRCSARDYFQKNRDRYRGNHLDLFEHMSNFGACRTTGGLDVLSKILGKPGKMDVAGNQVYEMYQAGRLQDINDYCMFDTLDTYFVFLRTRLMTGELTEEGEDNLVLKAKLWLEDRAGELPALNRYLENWEQ